MPTLPSLAELESAERIVYASMQPTPQYRWPVLEQVVGGELWVKHENHAPTGAFKVRGGYVYLHELAKSSPRVRGIVTATRGNHGLSIATAASAAGIPVAVLVPRGNALDKNRALAALGAEVIEHGDDVQESIEAADRLAIEREWHRVPSFHPLLVAGVATWALELLRAVPTIGTLYVPIGLGSGICGAIAARQALGLDTTIVGVVSSGAPAYARSLAARAVVSAPVSTRLADGLACRTPVPDAFATIEQGVARIIEVSDDEVAAAMRTLFAATHNAAEGAGAAALAGLLRDRESPEGRSRAIVLSGGNVDAAVFADALRS